MSKNKTQRQRIESMFLRGRFIPAFKFLDMHIPRYGDILYRLRKEGYEFIKYRKGNQDFWLCVNYLTMYGGMLPVDKSQYRKIREEAIDWTYCTADTKKEILKLI